LRLPAVVETKAGLSGNALYGTNDSPSSEIRFMVRTYGLTHVALGVRDLRKSTRFYTSLLGARVVYEDPSFVQLQTPGSRDVIVLERRARGAGKSGGIVHFGFRLRRATDIDRAIEAVKAAGGRVKSHGEFVPGEPYVFAADPDGYEIELWYEPTEPRG
jgi:catechol 2,3-dioxygenase-like lactoylglutathione lyase family enzyme